MSALNAASPAATTAITAANKRQYSSVTCPRIFLQSDIIIIILFLYLFNFMPNKKPSHLSAARLPQLLRSAKQSVWGPKLCAPRLAAGFAFIEGSTPHL